MELYAYLIENILTAGKTKDNYIFTKCDLDFLRQAKYYLTKIKSNVKSCVVQLDKYDVLTVNNLFLKCKDEIQKKVVAREYILQKVIMSELNGENLYKDEYNRLKQLQNKLKSGNLNAIFSNYNFSDVQTLQDTIGKIEINFFLVNFNNIYLQQAVNNFISSRTNYSVKIFSNNLLASYYDQAGNVIETPHDYLTLNIKEPSQQNNDSFKQ